MLSRKFYLSIAALLSFIILFSANTLIAKEQAAKTGEVKANPDERRYSPSYITIDGKQHVTVDDWTDPRICGQCHTEQYKGWNGSMHSIAFNDPVFQAEWALAMKSEAAKEIDMINHCGSCHSPIGVATNTIKFDPNEGLHGKFTAPGVAAMGVSCDVCHTISGTNVEDTAVSEHGNASIVMSPGKVKRANLKDAKSPFHDTEYSEHHDSSKFCGNCHNVFHPGNNFPIERTYDEWKYSVYAQNDVQCQDCHMVPVELAEKVADELKRPQELLNEVTHGFAGLGGKMRKVVHRHGFVGGNAIISQALANTKEGGSERPEDQGKNSNYDAAVKRLQGVASLKVGLHKQTGHLYKLKVKVTNERAGHNLPTSLTEIRQIWLEAIVTDDKGNELFRSGTLDEYNALPQDTVIFNAHAVDKDGNHTHFPWEITRFTDINTIPPKGHKYGKYYFNVPDGTTSIKTKVVLHYRSFSQEVADLLMGKGKLTVPNIEMVVDEQTLSLADINAESQQAKKEAH